MPKPDSLRSGLTITGITNIGAARRDYQMLPISGRVTVTPLKALQFSLFQNSSVCRPPLPYRFTAKIPFVQTLTYSIRSFFTSIPAHTPHCTAPRFLYTTTATFIMAPIPKSMSGILIEENGGIEVLKWKTDLPVPQPKDGEILVRNEFVGVNYIDT